MYTRKAFRSGRTALALAWAVVLMIAGAGVSAVAAEPDDVDSPIELADQQAGIGADVRPADVGSSIFIDPEVVARAMELHAAAEHGFRRPRMIGIDPEVVARAMELHAAAEGKR